MIIKQSMKKELRERNERNERKNKRKAFIINDKEKNMSK
jgi:hypothetical protein